MSFNVSYIIKAVDQFTTPARKIISSIGNISKSVNHLSERLRVASEKLKKTGEAMSLYFSAPILGFAALSMHEFDKSEKAIAQVRSALISTGGAAKLSLGQLEDAAAGLQSKSLFEHAEILSDVTAQLLRFKNLSGPTFLKAQKSIVDFSARTGTPLKSAAALIGRALSDPEKGMMRLQRVLALTKKQVDVIKHLAKTGHLEQAQNLIFGAFNKRFGGAAEAAAQAGLGPLEQLRHSINDFSEEIGGALAKAILPIVPIIKDFITVLKALDPHTKKLLMTIIGIVAVVGPLLVAISVFGMVFAGLGSAIAIIISPIGVFIILLGTLAYALYAAYKSADPAKYAIAAVGGAILTAIIAIRAGLGPISWMIAAVQLLAAAYMYATGHMNKFADAKNKINNHVGATGIDPNGLSLTDKMKNSVNGLIPGTFKLSGNHSRADINININDKNDTVKSVRTTKSGNANVNVGRNMAHAG